MTAVVMLAGLAIPFTELGDHLDLSPLPVAYYGWLFLILAGYMALAQAVKMWFVKKYGF